MRTTISLGVGGLVLALAAAQAGAQTLEEKAVDDPAKPDTFVGLYRIVSGEEDGEPAPADRIKDHVVRITEDMITVLDADENALYTCKYRLKDEGGPAAAGGEARKLDMESTGGPEGSEIRTARGIITRGTNDEGRPFVMLCYAMIGDAYPEDFRTRAESETNLFVLEPIPDPATPAPAPAGGAAPPAG